MIIRDKLTCRERQILDLVVLGKNNKEIARDLYANHSTVKSHVRMICVKTGRTRLQLIHDVLTEAVCPTNQP